MELLESIAKNEDIQNYMTENKVLIQIMDEESDKFGERLKGFILAHPAEFLGESVEETKKNRSAAKRLQQPGAFNGQLSAIDIPCRL